MLRTGPASIGHKLIMGCQKIVLPEVKDTSFIYLPPSIDIEYLQNILSDAMGEKVSIIECDISNLCDDPEWGVSCSGATVLHFSLTLGNGKNRDIVLKVLSPNSLNVFKTDKQFDARICEITWSKWWGEQELEFLPAIYDCRIDVEIRHFWVVQEYLSVNKDTIQENTPDSLPSDPGQLEYLFDCIAQMHGYSHNRLAELEQLFPGEEVRAGHQCGFTRLTSILEDLLCKNRILSGAGLTENELEILKNISLGIEQRPEWVDDWEIVCVHKDIGKHNIAYHETSGMVILDWGASQLGPMEEEFESIRRRWGHIDRDFRETLIEKYLVQYNEMTDGSIDTSVFIKRIPWASLLAVFRSLIYHMKCLEWVTLQPRVKEIIESLIPVCTDLLEECRETA